ncbi:MAG: ABC transporter permease [Synergistaceae bacterium]|nr:ABC transporter permease [Synergistaceae bacterium]
MRRLPAILLGLLLLLWEGGCRLSGLSPLILPPPSSVAAAFWTHLPLLASQALTTGGEILAGSALALAVALPLALLLFLVPSLEAFLAPLLVASQAIPVFALAPLLILWFGYGPGSKVVMAAIVVFFPITVSFLAGLRDCDDDYRNLLRLLGAGPIRTFVVLHLPWSLPFLLAGLKAGLSVATIGAVIGEWVGAKAGLGYLMIQANARLQTDLVFAAVLALTFMGLSLWIAVDRLERRLLRWKGGE